MFAVRSLAVKHGGARALLRSAYTCEMPRSLVTGGAGFLGSHLCDSLIASGHSVICLDNLFTGNRQNIAHLDGKRGFTFVHHDVVHPFDFDVDFIWNMACPAAPGHYRYEPVKTMMTSVLGALHSLQLAHRTGARLLHASTSEVYGDPEVHPQPESYRGNVNPIGPRACYDEGKRAAETLCFDYRRMHGTSIKVVRIFNTYGPRMHPYDGRVVSNFIRQAVGGEALTIFGDDYPTQDGTCIRDYVHVSDLVDAHLAALAALEIGQCKAWNVGLGCGHSVRDVVESCRRVSARQIDVQFAPRRAGDPAVLYADPSAIKRDLGWHAKFSSLDAITASAWKWMNRGSVPTA